MGYSVLIIDDEFYICDGLKTKLENLNFSDIQEIRTCYSGEEALELCRTFHPEIVITDIKMDGMDGIHLIHELKKKLHPVRFLILSGYDNYDYIRKSFREGAADYLLKPILSEDLKRIISEQLRCLNHEMHSSLNSRSSSITLAEQLFQHLVHPLDNENLENIINGLPHAFCRIFSIAWEPKKNFSIPDFLDQIYSHFSMLSNCLVLACSCSSEKAFVLLNTDDKTIFSLSFWETMIKSCQQDHFLPLAVGVSQWNAPACISALYYEAENQLARRLLEGYAKIYQGTAIHPVKELPAKLRQLTLQLFNSPELASDKTFFQKLICEIRQLSLPELKRYYNFFSGAYISFTSNYEPDESQIEFRSFYDFSNYDQLEKYLFEKLSDYAAYIIHGSRSNIELAKEYVDDHFTEPLKMSEVADRFFISYSHLSKLFHKKVGMTFQEYLISKRMNYAAELLQDPLLNIQEVSSAVGYDNVFNFSRAFKKYFGIAPNHYRDN